MCSVWPFSGPNQTVLTGLADFVYKNVRLHLGSKNVGLWNRISPIEENQC